MQRYRRRNDAAYRLEIMAALRDPLAARGIAIPVLRRYDVEASPPGPSLRCCQAQMRSEQISAPLW